MKIILFLCAAMACWAPSLASAHGHGFYGGYRGFSSSPSFYGNYSSSGSSGHGASPFKASMI